MSYESYEKYPGVVFEDDEEPGVEKICEGVVIEDDDEPGYYPVFRPKTKFSPMPHQKTALEWMAKRELDDDIQGGILGLSMGLGKTFTSLLHIIRESPNSPTLIVVPKTAIYTWESEIKKFFGNTMSVLIFRKDNPKIKTITPETINLFNVVITNYEYIRGIASKYDLYDKLAMRDVNGRVFGANIPLRPIIREARGELLLFSKFWHRVIADESHNFSNYKTELWKAMMCICSTYRWCLSGTPIKNYGEDLYAQYKFLGYYEPEFDVKKFYTLNLGEYLYYSNYEKAGIVLPKATHKKIECELTGEHAKIYNMFLTETKKEFNNFTVGGATFASVFTQFLRLRQICLAPYTITPESDKTPNKKVDLADYERSQQKIDKMTEGLASWVRDKDGEAGIKSVKLEKATKIINNIPKGEKVVVFTIFKRVIDLLVEKFSYSEGIKKTFIAIDGTVVGKDRDRAIDSFKKDNVDVMFISYKIGAESLNLTEAQHVILLEPYWSPAVIDQAKARIHRVGQDKPVTIYELYVPNTDDVVSIEQAIVEICDNKRKIAKEYLNDGKSEKGSKIDAKTMGMILNARRSKIEDPKKKKGMHCN